MDKVYPARMKTVFKKHENARMNVEMVILFHYII